MSDLRGNPVLHFFDRYVGIPVVALCGGIRRRRILPSRIETIGLLKSGAIGDTVLISGIIADLKCAFPRASLVFFSGDSNHEIACMLDGLERVINVPVGNPLAGARIMRSVPVDVMIGFGQWSRLEALFSLAGKTAFTIGFQTAKQYRHYGYDIAVEHSADTHELENYRRLVQVLGVRTGHLPFLRNPAAEPLKTRDYAVCHLWPGGRRKELKQWPTEKWLMLFEELTSWGLEVVLTGASPDGANNDSVIARLPLHTRCSVRNAAGVSLRQTVAILARASLVVSVDTGIMHVAAALGAPLVAMHGPTSSKRWGPLGKKSIAIDTPLSEGGYISMGWEKLSSPPACMESISFKSVRDACHALVEKRSQEHATAQGASFWNPEKREH